jgi:RNA polymerase sigma-70 factor (ECF subfamily)
LEIQSETITAPDFRMEMTRYQQPLVGVAYRITGDIEAARDIVQDTYTSILQTPGNFNGASSIKTYLYRIVINKSIDSRRRRIRWLGILEKIVHETAHQPQANVDEDSDKYVLLRAALDKIPDSFRIPFLLAEADGMSYEEIADLLKVAINTVRTRIYRCKEKLRKKLNKAGYL